MHASSSPGSFFYMMNVRSIFGANEQAQRMLGKQVESWPALSQFYGLKTRRLTSFMKYRNVVQRILKLKSCGRVGRGSQ